MTKLSTKNIAMTLRFFILLIIVSSLIFFLTGCTASQKTDLSWLHDGKYDSQTPISDPSESLRQISESVYLISSMHVYKRFEFSEASKITLKNLRQTDLEKEARGVTTHNDFSSGSSALIQNKEGVIALLTAAHVVYAPDTIYTYYQNEFGFTSGFLQSVSIKISQSIFAANFPEGGRVEILAIDHEMDVALLGARFNPILTKMLPTFKFPFGQSKELSWGNFVYVFGYPMNYKMVTSGIVSVPYESQKEYFLIDAALNRGHSGGLVLAVRDDAPNFELVGIIRWIPIEADYFLKPRDLKTGIQYDEYTPYNGESFVSKYKSIRYGIAKVINIELVVDFLNSKLKDLKEKGYDLDKIQTKAYSRN